MAELNAVLVGSYAAGERPCEVCGRGDYPVIELVLEAKDTTALACALCCAEAFERASGWRFTNLVRSMRAGALTGELIRAENPPRQKRRGHRLTAEDRRIDAQIGASLSDDPADYADDGAARQPGLEPRPEPDDIESPLTIDRSVPAARPLTNDDVPTQTDDR